MTNWLVEQQLVISFLLLTLIILEAKAIKKPRRKSKSRFKKKSKIKSIKKTNQKTRALVSGLLKFNDRFKSLLRFNFNGVILMQLLSGCEIEIVLI